MKYFILVCMYVLSTQWCSMFEFVRHFNYNIMYIIDFNSNYMKVEYFSLDLIIYSSVCYNDKFYFKCNF